MSPSEPIETRLGIGDAVGVDVGKGERVTVRVGSAVRVRRDVSGGVRDRWTVIEGAALSLTGSVSDRPCVGRGDAVFFGDASGVPVA
jgi:hypothetical protein